MTATSHPSTSLRMSPSGIAHPIALMLSEVEASARAGRRGSAGGAKPGRVDTPYIRCNARLSDSHAAAPFRVHLSG
ncbi:MAG: hypothetical protein JJ954_04645 [Hyphomonas sp.]|uniref:hypothetical protein n=1 Tax=Hyphomonas sp. TaxID=87 RepID=UPI001B06C923|nr:hypothetical protein [Hyphomonas sp.]MBO6582224.1 hypothetical protein [Hyphomonas sp.]